MRPPASSMLFVARRCCLAPSSTVSSSLVKATQLTRRQKISQGPSASDDASRQVILDSDPAASHVAVLTLNRPKAANAMGSALLTELEQCFEKIIRSKEKYRCLVVTSSNPKVFSAGADLKERATMTPDQAEEFVTRLRTTMNTLASSLPIPSIAAMEGVAVGGGLELALATDIRVASTSVKLGLPETSLAIVPGAGGTQRLPRLIGTGRAKELIFTGRILTGEEAIEYGLVEHLVEEGRTREKAMEIAALIAKNGPVAIRAAKEAIDVGMEAPSMEEALEVERRCYTKVLRTSDRLEGLAAFKDGRPPVYKGE